jgi:3-hydroxyisobutyrate dehydrogenase-like beta-hydroxyacid dehydrogenase
MSAVGFVGLGAMGGRVAARLLASGHQVYGTNRTALKGAPLVERGLQWRDTPRAVAEASDVVFSMVTDDAALEAVASGPDGILAGLGPGMIYVDMSTVSPDASRELADLVYELDAVMLDAPVSGSVPAAEEGALAVMVGGDAPTAAWIEPLLRRFAQTVTYVGPNGSALMMKLAVNISLAAQMVAFSEGVLLAESAGIDPKIAVDVLRSSAVGSPMLRMRAPLLFDRPDEAWFDVNLMQKDVGLALEQGRTWQVPLPSAAIANELLTAARAQGYGEHDMVAVFDVLARLAGREAVVAA